jgi:hypothetical protein
MIDKRVLASVLESKLNDAHSFDLAKICFPKQLAFIQDKSPWVTASCSRRSGKTEACALDLINTALKHPGVNCLYITLTRANAERIVWAKLQAINEAYGLKGVVNLSKLTITFPNKSVIYLSGCNDKSELDKFRGLALKLVYIDEAQSFKSFIAELVDEVVAPALADYAGSLKFLGTPAPIPSGYFYDTIQSKSYAHHSWTFFDNPFIADKAGISHREILDRELQRRNISVDDASIRREWFGEWTVDTDSLVFKYDRSRNGFEHAPELTDFVIGIDIGFEDADAIAVIGWHKYRPGCYLVEEVLTKGQDITSLSETASALIKRYDPLKVVMDTGGLGKKIAEELRKRFDLPIHAAEKSRKQEYIALLNDAMRTSKFYAKTNGRFAADCSIVEWDYDKSTPDRLVIKDEPHSDICDAVLYAYRESLHWQPDIEPKSVDIKQRNVWIEHTRKLMEENLEKQIQAQQAQESFDDAVAIMDMDPFDDMNAAKHYLNKRR